MKADIKAFGVVYLYGYDQDCFGVDRKGQYKGNNVRGELFRFIDKKAKVSRLTWVENREKPLHQ